MNDNRFARFCTKLQPMIEDLACQMDYDWRGEDLIRSTPRARPVPVEPEPAPARGAERVMAVRNALRAGLSRVETAELLGLSYNTVVWICQRHGITFPDARLRRRRTGEIA